MGARGRFEHQHLGSFVVLYGFEERALDLRFACGLLGNILVVGAMDEGTFFRGEMRGVICRRDYC